MAKKKVQYQPKSKVYLRGILLLLVAISVLGFVLMVALRTMSAISPLSE